MVTHFCILAWRIPRTEEPGSLQSKESDMTEAAQHAQQLWVPASAMEMITDYDPLQALVLHPH